MSVVEEAQPRRLLRKKREKRVRVREGAPPQDGSDELQDLLIRNLVLHGEDETKLSRLGIRELVLVAAKFYGVPVG